MRDWILRLIGLFAGLGALSHPVGAAELPKQCTVPSDLLRLSYPLPQFSEKLRRGEPVTIVAIGSSSTAGTGASSSKATYPSQLQAELKSMFPQSAVTVLNRGVPGDMAAATVARFKHDAIEPKPDLIVFQTGTNSALGGGNV